MVFIIGGFCRMENDLCYGFVVFVEIGVCVMLLVVNDLGICIMVIGICVCLLFRWDVLLFGCEVKEV